MQFTIKQINGDQVLHHKTFWLKVLMMYKCTKKQPISTLFITHTVFWLDDISLTGRFMTIKPRTGASNGSISTDIIFLSGNHGGHHSTWESWWTPQYVGIVVNTTVRGNHGKHHSTWESWWTPLYVGIMVNTTVRGNHGEHHSTVLSYRPRH